VSMHQILVLNRYVADFSTRLILYLDLQKTVPEVNLFHSSDLIFITY